MKATTSFLACLSLFAITAFADDTVTAAPVAATTAAVQNWETIVTWPAGCESWANPCPAGAHVAGGGAAATGTVKAAAAASGSVSVSNSDEPYENPFTIYTTMTNSDGVITGMPPVATVAAGVTDATTLSTVTRTSSSSSSSFSFNAGASSSAAARPTANAAASERTVAGAAVFGVAGLVLALM
jgi:hypothetical protein